MVLDASWWSLMPVDGIWAYHGIFVMGIIARIVRKHQGKIGKSSIMVDHPSIARDGAATWGLSGAHTTQRVTDRRSHGGATTVSWLLLLSYRSGRCESCVHVRWPSLPVTVRRIQPASSWPSHESTICFVVTIVFRIANISDGLRSPRC